MKAIYLILMMIMSFFINCNKAPKDPCEGVVASPGSLDSSIIKFLVKPNGTAKKVIISSTNLGFSIRKKNNVVRNVIDQDVHSLQFEINGNLLEQKEVIIKSGLLDANTKYSFDIKVFEGSNTFFEKQVNIKTGMGEKTYECAWDETATTLEEVTVNDMQYVKKIAKKGVFFMSNEAIILEF